MAGVAGVGVSWLACGIPPNRGHGNVSLAQGGGWRMIVREGKVEIGNSGQNDNEEAFSVTCEAVIRTEERSRNG